MARKYMMKKLPTDRQFQRMLKEMREPDKEPIPDTSGIWSSIVFVLLIAGGVAGLVYLFLLHF